MKAIERLIEALPMPLIAAVAAAIVVAWLVKELHRHSRYGDALRDTFFIAGLAIIAIVTSGYYAWFYLETHGPPVVVPKGETAVLIAQFGGDPSNVVQTHLVELLKTKTYGSKSYDHVAVVPIDRNVDSHNAAILLLQESGGSLMVWGTLVGDKILHGCISVSSSGAYARQTLSTFPEVTTFENAVLQQLRSSRDDSEAVEERITAMERQLVALSQNLDHLMLRTDQLEVRGSLSAPGPVDSRPPQGLSEFANQRRVVLSIGINSYQNPQLSDLQFAVNDAQGVVEALLSTKLTAVEYTVLADENATRFGILEAMNKIAESVGEDDQVWLFYAGIGVTEEGQGYIVPHDADPENLATTAISMSDLGTWLSDLPAKQAILISDTCHSGAMALTAHRGIGISVATKDPRQLQLSGTGRAILTAGTADQLSIEVPDLQHGFFTYFVIRGLTGSADLNRDRLVTLNELYAYTSSEVSIGASSRGFSLTPTLSTAAYSDFALTVVEKYIVTR